MAFIAPAFTVDDLINTVTVRVIGHYRNFNSSTKVLNVNKLLGNLAVEERFVFATSYEMFAFVI